MGREAKAVLLLVALAVGGLLALGLHYGGYFAPESTCPGGACPDVECTPEGCRVIEPSGPPRDEVERLRLTDAAPGERPVVDLPEEMRTKNYLGGSCVHASTINLLKWQGLDEMAEWWRANHGHGEYAERLASKMDKAGLKFAYTTSGDPAFIEWAIRTRRGAGIGYKPSHAINIVGLNETHAILLDNNRTHTYEYVPRETFFRNWRGFGGWAWAVIYEPPAPRPWARLASNAGRCDCGCRENGPCLCGPLCEQCRGGQ